MDLIRKQAQRFGAECKWETVFEVDLSKRPFRVRTTDDPSGDPSSGTLARLHLRRTHRGYGCLRPMAWN